MAGAIAIASMLIIPFVGYIAKRYGPLLFFYKYILLTILTVFIQVVIVIFSFDVLAVKILSGIVIFLNLEICRSVLELPKFQYRKERYEEYADNLILKMEKKYSPLEKQQKLDDFLKKKKDFLLLNDLNMLNQMIYILLSLILGLSLLFFVMDESFLLKVLIIVPTILPVVSSLFVRLNLKKNVLNGQIAKFSSGQIPLFILLNFIVIYAIYYYKGNNHNILVIILILLLLYTFVFDLVNRNWRRKTFHIRNEYLFIEKQKSKKK